VHLEEALALARRQQDRAGLVQALIHLGVYSVFTGQAERAAQLQQEALSHRRELGKPALVGQTLYVLAVASQARGDATAAAARFEEALAHLEAAGDMRVAGNVHVVLAPIAGRQGDLAAALWHLRAGLEASATLRDRWLLSLCAEVVPAVLDAYANHGDPVGRARLLGAADALRQAIGAGHTSWEHVMADPSVAAPRVRLMQRDGTAAYREGRALSAGEVVRLALRLLDEVAQTPASPHPDAALDSVR
jgi:hypothetical protein